MQDIIMELLAAAEYQGDSATVPTELLDKLADAAGIVQFPYFCKPVIDLLKAEAH